MNFVYPFIHSKTNKELELSILSVQKFFQGIPTIYVLGDNPNIPEINYVPVNRKSNSFLDVLAKLKFATNILDNEEFVWMMDDIWFIKPLSISELKTPRAYNPKTPQELVDWKPSNKWQTLKKKTLLELYNKGKTYHDYATHLPHVVEKSKVRKIITDWNLETDLKLWEIVYGNLYNTNPINTKPFFTRWSGPKTSDWLEGQTKHSKVVNSNHAGFDVEAQKFLERKLDIPLSVTNSDKPPKTVKNRSSRISTRQSRQQKQITKKVYYKQDWKQPFATEVSDKDQCPINQRGNCVEVKNNKVCGARSKRSEPVFECHQYKELVTINPYKVGQLEGCCKRCPFFWKEESQEIPTVTSLYPKENNRQTEALNSWKRRGFKIIACQPLSEIDDCKKLYPQVDQWIEVPGPRPKISDIIKVNSEKDFMLINSDIKMELRTRLPKIIHDTLICCARHDHPKGDLKNQSCQRWGLDIFLIPKEVAQSIIDAPFRIGKPAWDYWLPQQCLENGYNLKISMRSGFLHESHNLNWSKHEGEVYRKLFCSHFNVTYKFAMDYRYLLQKYEDNRI